MLNILTAVWALLSGLLSQFGAWFKPIIKDGEDTYDTLEVTAQKALQEGSGVIAVFNQDLDATPADIKALLQKAFPSLSFDVVHGFLETILNKMGAVQKDIPVTFDDAIVAFQGFLKQHQEDNSFLGRISKFLAGEFTILASPETPIQKIDDSLEYVYHLIVKPHVAAIVSTYSPATPEQPAGFGIEPPAAAAEVNDPEQGSLQEVQDPNVSTGQVETDSTAPTTETEESDTSSETTSGSDANTASTSEAETASTTNTAGETNAAEQPQDEAAKPNLSFEEAMKQQQGDQPPPPTE